jgi:hypothetical protein
MDAKEDFVPRIEDANFGFFGGRLAFGWLLL